MANRNNRNKEFLDIALKRMEAFIAETGKEMDDTFKCAFVAGFVDCLAYIEGEANKARRGEA